MQYWIITFFLGVCSLYFFPDLPSLYWLFVMLPIIFFWLFNKNKIIKKVFFQMLVFSLGFFWVVIYSHWIMSWALPAAIEGKEVEVTGFIASVPNNRAHGIGFEFKTLTIADEKIKTKLKLSWYKDYPSIKAGDKWRLLVRLKRPHGVLNPGGFDTEKNLLIHHVRATGYVVSSENNLILSSKLSDYPVSRLRQFLIAKIVEALKDDHLVPILIALITGSEDKITQEQWQILRDTGTSYLVAISGLHVGLVAGFVFLLVQSLWGFSGRLPLVISAKEIGLIAGLVVGLGYAALSGFSVPAQRAIVMLVMFSLAALLRRFSKSWNAWLWSVFFVMMINPLAILTAGFWLSFMAVAAIIYVASCRIKQSKSRVRKFWQMQVAVTLALFPLTLLFFQQMSLVSLLANMIAMPGVCFIVVPISLFGALCLLLIPGSFGAWVLWGSAKLLEIIWYWLTFLVSYFECSWYYAIYNNWVLAAACIGVIILLAPRGVAGRYLGLVGFFPLFFYQPPLPSDNGFWFTLLDVGQGLSTVVQTKNHVLIYDAGPKFFEHDAGARVVIPYLRKKGIREIDVLMVSHGDTDHIGGASSILKSLPVNQVVTSVPEKFNHPSAHSCIAGQSWEWDGVSFQVLAPAKNSSFSGNNGSCVLKVSSCDKSLLLPGDIEHEVERVLIENSTDQLKSTVLIAPHHGSKTSSTSDFIGAIQPEYVIFPVGYRNRFRLPHKNVIARYLKSKTILLNVSEIGAITFKFNDKSAILTPEFYRQVAKRFWHEN